MTSYESVFNINIIMKFLIGHEAFISLCTLSHCVLLSLQSINQSINQSPVSPLEEHRAFTNYFHRSQLIHFVPCFPLFSNFLQNCSLPCISRPSSCSITLRNPIQSHFSTALYSFLIVCPIQFHFRLLISIVISLCMYVYLGLRARQHLRSLAPVMK